jgi:chorismate-pyruvate lyase
MKAGIAIMAIGLSTALPAAAQDARAAYDAFEAELNAGPTATAALQRWCEAHGVTGTVIAEVDRDAERAPSAATYLRLQVSPDEPIAYRRVRLGCGGHVLSEAENWYVPARLTAAMNAALETGDTPFGAVIAPLVPHRQVVSSERLWADGAAPDDILRNRGLVLDREGRPLAEVSETYKRSALEIVR